MSSPYCNLCGRLITGQSEQFHHSAWSEEYRLRVCQDCLREKPRCRSCQTPMALQSNGFCVTCTKVEQRCLICGRRIRGRYWKVNNLGPYCDNCYRGRPVCDLCGAPLGNDLWTLSDGRVFCKRCRDTGVFTYEEAVTLFAESKRVIAQTLGLQLNIPTPLLLVDRDQLLEVVRKQSNGSQILDIKRTLGIYARSGIKRGIYVQTGLPRQMFLKVASHEYAHAWQGENCPLLKDLRFREGFAEWVAYIVLSHYNLQDQMVRMINEDNIYSQGLELMLELESKVGRRGVLEACRKLR